MAAQERLRGARLLRELLARPGITVLPSTQGLAVGALPPLLTPGIASAFTMTALDAFGNADPSYRGTVVFSESSGGNASLDSTGIGCEASSC